MNSKNIVKFLAIVVLIGILGYVAAYGLQLGKYEVIPVKDLIKLGLDLRGGADVVLEAQDNPDDPITDEKIERAIATIRERIDSLGVTEPVITRQGAKRIRIGLPEIQDTQRALEVIGKTAQLKFVDEAGNTVITGNDIKDAKAVYGSKGTGIQEPVVSLELTPDGAKKFALGTSNNIGKIIAIYLDESVISAPQVGEAITDGKCQISGKMNMEEAADLAMLIRAGALPVELKTLQVTSVGPELGANSFEKSLAAGKIGILLVLVFMALYYRLPGLVADIALILYLCIVLFALATLKATLTLPGIAGIILSVGMAVDANVIIFERLKEELKLGKSLRAAIDSGFRRAFLTIFDSNITTLIAAVVLFYFGSGPIKGFAVTLSIGILASMFTAIVVTKQLMKLLSGISALSNKKFYGTSEIKPMKKFNFVEYKKIWFSISLAVIAVGLVFTFMNGGLNYGIDFTGGTTIQANIGKNFEVDEVRTIIDKYDSEAIVTYAGNEKDEVIIRTKVALDDTSRKEILDSFASKFAITSSNINFETIGPAIGNELKKQAFLSLVLANIGILIYVSFRFEWKFGLAAIIALIHDVIAMVILYGVMKIPVNSSFIAAILTIVGYSINNTIVIFDRIRENMKNVKKVDDVQLVDESISQTMSRSINTSLTTLIAIMALYILGVPAIKDFALPLIVGMVSGTYSSIFLSGPIWILLKNMTKTKTRTAH